MNIARNLHRLLLSSRCDPKCVRSLRQSGGRPPPFDTTSHSRASEKDKTATSHPSKKYIAKLVTQTSPPSEQPLTELDIDWSREMKQIRAEESARSVFAPAADDFDVTTAAPQTRPAHNLAAYVKRSPTLQQLLHLGVDLHRIERRNGLADFVLRLDFEKDVKPRLRFLADVGVPADALGDFLTRNPLICREDVNALTTRIHYLQSKGFVAADIARIVETNPFWLMFSTQRIDGRLGFFQKQFELSGVEVRQLVVRQAKLITYGLDAVRKSSFVLQEELGFSQAETKRLLLTAPKLWMMNTVSLTDRFEYLHKTMGIAHDRIVQQPDVLYCRKHRLQERHEYLRQLSKAQYDPRQPLYVSFKQLTAGSDQDFALNVARTSLSAYEEYLRTL